MLISATKFLRTASFSQIRNQSSLHLLNQHGYINGEWVPAKSKKTFEVRNPANGEVLSTAADMNVEDAENAIQAASEAFKTWREITPKERARHLIKWYDLLEKNQESLAKIMTAESGKPLIEARGEVGYGNSFIEFYSEQARHINGEVVASAAKNKKYLIEKHPIGVVGLITPWNFPQALILRKAGAALAAGCTCIIKPAEDTPFTALALMELAETAGIPKGVLNVVTSDRPHAPDIGNLLCTSPLVAGISFTGSTDVGRILYKQCASGIKRLGLELGGNAPFIVYNSAKIDLAVKGAITSKFRNCGQTCVASNRFLVQNKIYDEFISKLVDGIKALKIGDGTQPGVQMGPLVNKAQFLKVSSMVDDATAKGAKLLLGGKPAVQHGELFYEPTVLTDLKENMKVYSEEVFGPVLNVFRFETEEESLQIANNTQSGLAGYFFSEDVAQIFRVARKLDVGMIGVNEGLISAAEAPFGGVKESGLGREGSHHGLDDFLYIKYICLGNL